MVGCIANDLFPHLSVYERAFVAANTFWFFKHIFVLSTVSACVKVGIRSRFNSGYPYAVEDNLKFGFCSLPVLIFFSISDIFWTLTSVALVTSVLMKIPVKASQQKLSQVNVR